ncbi:MAG: ABC transporter ATP-binding protein, partial [Anaerolineae bacterium]|nr:ABC transporter ATP-binding protein [Anaerolineae bacterium]
VRQMLGLVNTHERSFFWRLTGRQNLEFFAALHNLRGRALQRRIADLLELLDLAAEADRLFMHYSTGMQQKLAIARGLLANPHLLFLDEPTRSLDPVSARQVRQFIRTKLVDEVGCTVVLVTHHLAEAEALCDRLAIMHQGRVLTCGSPATIKQYAPQRQRYRLQVRDMLYPALDELPALPGVVRFSWSNGRPRQLELELDLVDEQATLPAVMRLIVERGGAIQQCRAAEVSLEEIFMQLIQEPGDGL